MKPSQQRGGKLKSAPPSQQVTQIPLPIRITPDLIERIDAIRPDLIPREPFVRHVLDLGLRQLEEEG